MKIATPMGELEVKPAQHISKRYWTRIEELCMTAHDPDELRKDLSIELLCKYGVRSHLDRCAFLYLNSDDREVVLTEWLESSKTLAEFEHIIDSFGETTDPKEPRKTIKEEERWRRVGPVERVLKTLGNWFARRA